MEELNTQKFEAVKELAKVQGEISTARATLSELKIGIKKFLEERKEQEKLALKELLNESTELVGSINSNFDALKAFYNEIKADSRFVKEMQTEITALIEDFTKESNEFVKWVKIEDEELANKRKELENQVKELDKERETIKKEWKKIEKEQIKIKDDRGQIIRTIERLKRGKI